MHERKANGNTCTLMWSFSEKATGNMLDPGYFVLLGLTFRK